MEEREIDTNQSFELINKMVNQAQNKFTENGFLLLFWGWLVFITALVFYCLISAESSYASLAWVTMPFGGIFTAVYVMKKNKTEKVKSFSDDYIGYVSIAFTISMFIVLTQTNKLQLNCYPIIILLYAIMTFVIGGIIRFKPLIICALVSFVLAFAAFYFQFKVQILLIALSVLVSYILPGHLLMRKFKSQNNV